MVKSYKLFLESRSSSSIESICKEYNIQNCTLNEDGSIDVDGNVYLSNKRLTKLPLKFGHVSGSFDCHANQLSTLEGAPKSVGGSFYCHNNQLISLEGAPKSVGCNFYCNRNLISTLKGGPKSVGGHFYCDDNQLTSIEGCPEYFKFIYVYSNPIYEFAKLFNKLTPDIVRYLGEYDVIQDDVIVLDRLKEVVDILKVKFYFNGLRGLKNYKVE